MWPLFLRLIEARIDPNETYLVNTTTINHTKAATPKAFGASINMTPMLVAIPLPPLNLKNTVHIWPHITLNPIRRVQQRPNW